MSNKEKATPIIQLDRNVKKVRLNPKQASPVLFALFLSIIVAVGFVSRIARCDLVA